MAPEESPARSVLLGHWIEMKSVMKVPADGVIVAGESSVDEALLTGESAPHRVAFEGARNMRARIVDKTGTLTEGRFGVTDATPALGAVLMSASTVIVAINARLLRLPK